MALKQVLENIKKAWNWIWKSNSLASWLIALLLMFIFVKFIFFPVLSLIMGSSLPLAGVESSSMTHYSEKYCLVYSDSGNCEMKSQDYEICGKNFNEKISFDFNKYWETCGKWYENNEITKQEFEKFSLKNGFQKGDVIIVWGRFTPKIGDIIIFKPNKESLSPNPIIHRIIKIEEKNKELIYQTKGDHNEEQLKINNNIYKTDETYITQEQIIGKAVSRIKYLGWFKIIFESIIKGF